VAALALTLTLTLTLDRRPAVPASNMQFLSGEITGADVADHLAGVAGEPVDLFLDDHWVQAGFGHIDLFGAYTDRAGRSIDLHESLLAVGGKSLMVYGVPARNVEGFLSFLDGHAYPLADGGFVHPYVLRAGNPRLAAVIPPAMPACLRSVLTASNLIVANPVAADDPSAMVARMRNRDLLAAGRRW
jgi:hypothetical protein